jgi:hypothetical protein
MANQTPQKPDLREVVFKETESFSTEFINGVFGSVGTTGVINVSFFRDKALLPEKIWVEVKDNKVLRESKRVGGNYTRRDIFFEAIIDTDTAKIIAEWLLSKAAEYEKLTKDESANINI